MFYIQDFKKNYFLNSFHLKYFFLTKNALHHITMISLKCENFEGICIRVILFINTFESYLKKE